MKINQPLSLLALVGIFIFVFLIFAQYSHDPESFEEDASPFAMLSQTEMTAVAIAFVNTSNPLHSPKTFATFQTHKSFASYLQKNNLTTTYLQKFGDRYPLDYFTIDIKDQDTIAHYSVDINMHSGEVLGWSEVSAEHGEPVDQQSERRKRMASLYLGERGYDLQRFTMVEADNETLERTILESPTDVIGDAKLQLVLHSKDGLITGIYPLFSIPQHFDAWFTQQNRLALLLTLVGTVGAFAMTAFAIIFTIRNRKQIVFSRGIVLTLIFLTIYVVNNVNMYPALRSVHESAGSENSAFGIMIVISLIALLLLAVSLYLYLNAGQAMWRKRGWNAWPHWKEHGFGEHVLRSMGRGYLLCFFILGVQRLLFYVAETHFQVWSVNDASDSFYNMFIPALFPLMAWVAAISEEAAFRLFGIAMFKRLLRNTFLAVLIPSMIWGLSHTQYPIYPVYTRFIEVTILGLIFGYAFLKYGFITAVFAHASMDSILMGLSLLFMGTSANFFLGLLYVFLPAMIGYLIHYVHSRRWWRKIPSLPPEATG